MVFSGLILSILGFLASAISLSLPMYSMTSANFAVLRCGPSNFVFNCQPAVAGSGSVSLCVFSLYPFRNCEKVASVSKCTTWFVPSTLCCDARSTFHVVGGFMLTSAVCDAVGLVLSLVSVRMCFLGLSRLAFHGGLDGCKPVEERYTEAGLGHGVGVCAVSCCARHSCGHSCHKSRLQQWPMDGKWPIQSGATKRQKRRRVVRVILHPCCNLQPVLHHTVLLPGCT